MSIVKVVNMKPPFSFTIILLLSVFFLSVNSTTVNKCTSGDSPVPEVEIANCDKSPCIFYINSTAVMTMKFRAPRYLEHIAPRAVAYLGAFPIPYSLGQDDACVGVTNTPCPLAEREYIEYSYAMFISPIFPVILITLEFSLLDLDQNNEAFECFRVDLQLAKP